MLISAERHDAELLVGLTFHIDTKYFHSVFPVCER